MISDASLVAMISDASLVAMISDASLVAMISDASLVAYCTVYMSSVGTGTGIVRTVC